MYVRVNTPLNQQVIVSDDIVLDETAPQVLSADLAVPAAGGSRVRASASLRIHARDRRSGVARIRSPTTAITPVSGRAIARSPRPHGKGALFIRVADGAKNVSRWHRVHRGHR